MKQTTLLLYFIAILLCGTSSSIFESSLGKGYVLACQ